MKQNTKLTQLCQILIVTITIVTVFASNESFSSSLPGCKNICGDVKIPYPFGISNSSIQNKVQCFLDPNFELTCENNKKLLWGNVPVHNINILQGQLEVFHYVAHYCNNTNSSTLPTLDTGGGFSISRKENKFLTVGCNSIGYLNSIYDKETCYTGCLTICNGNRNRIENGTCSGIGCCQVDIPPMMRNITIQASDYFDSNESLGCSYSFVVKNGFYNFSVSHLDHFPDKMLPMILDWSVGSKNCKTSKGEDHYACKNNSFCDDNKDIDFGYRCKCKDGFKGNPYHPDGCKGNLIHPLHIILI